MSAITDALVLLAVHGILSIFLQHHISKLPIFVRNFLSVVHVSAPYVATGKTRALTSLTLVDVGKSLSFHIFASPHIAVLPRANLLTISCLQLPSSSKIDPRRLKWSTTSMFLLFSLKLCNSAVDITFVS